MDGDCDQDVNQIDGDFNDDANHVEGPADEQVLHHKVKKTHLIDKIKNIKARRKRISSDGNVNSTRRYFDSVVHQVNEDDDVSVKSDTTKQKTIHNGVKNSKKAKRKAMKMLESIYRENLANCPDKDLQELELEKLVFGGEEEIIKELEAAPIKKKKKNKVIDTAYGADEETFQCVVREDQEQSFATRKSAWEDEDDDNILVSEKISTYNKCHRSVSGRKDEKYLKFAQEKFIMMTGNPDWADLDMKGATADSDAESEEELLQKAGNYIVQSVSLPKSVIDIRKCPNITDASSSMDIVKSVEFHPMAKVALAAGYSGTATLYQVDGKTNPKIQSVHFENFPIHTAHFSVDGNELVAGSKNFRHFYTYDMLCGKICKVPLPKAIEQWNVRRFQMSPDGKYMVLHGRYGYIYLLSSKTKELLKSLKMNGEVISITFNKDGSRMYSFGDAGQVYIWDLKNKVCIHKFIDEGCQIGTSLALSPNDQFLACGSDSGIVNVYNCSDVTMSSNPMPQKAIKNLTTEVSNMKFNHTSEILAMSSSLKPNGLKMMHFPSLTAFSNFPTHEKQFGYINSLDISLNSGYLMFGNNKGKVYLYRLRHYTNF